jgi:release factor glutamine methyltransferase
MTRDEALHMATHTLRRAGFEDAAREARHLTVAALKIESVDLVSRGSVYLTESEEKLFEAWLARREQHEPLARIRGSREFWGLDFALNEATLEPRPDTETLVEAVLNAVPDAYTPLFILDIGTGTGCILLSLLQEYAYASGIGTDISAAALEAATANARIHAMHHRANFICTSWADGLDETFDLVVSNPPYIESAVIPTLDANVRDHDPLAALDGGPDGLDAYRAIVPRAAACLNKNGILAVEIGQNQHEAVKALFDAGGFTDIRTFDDLAGITRVVLGVKK